MIPQVVTGARGADDRIVPATPFVPTQVLNLRPGQVEYHSIHTGLRVQLTSPQDVLHPDGTRTIARPLSLAFVNGRAITDNVDVVHRVEGCVGAETDSKNGCKLHKKGFEPHKNFGLDKSFWRADQRAAQIKQAQTRVAIETMKANPEALKQALQEMGFDEIPLAKKLDGMSPAASPAAR